MLTKQRTMRFLNFIPLVLLIAACSKSKLDHLSGNLPTTLPMGSSMARIVNLGGFTDLVIDTLNVWNEQLPEFDAESIGAKYKGVSGAPLSATEQKTWESIQRLSSRFKNADRIVLGVPMWNFSYPYKFKQLVDLSCQRNMLFTFDGKNYGPSLTIDKAFDERDAVSDCLAAATHVRELAIGELPAHRAAAVQSAFLVLPHHNLERMPRRDPLLGEHLRRLAGHLVACFLDELPL